MVDKTETEALVQFKLKLPLSMHDRLRSAARKNHRPLSSEIVAILESALQHDAPPQGGIGRPFDVIHAGLLELLSIVQQQREKD